MATAQTCSRRKICSLCQKGLLPGSPSLLLVSCDKLLQMISSTPVKCLSDKEAKLWTMAAGLPTPGNHLTLCLLPNLLQSHTNTHSSLKAIHKHGPLDGLEVGWTLTTGKGWPRRMNSCRRTFCRTSPLNCTIPQSLQKAHTRYPRTQDTCETQQVHSINIEPCANVCVPIYTTVCSANVLPCGIQSCIQVCTLRVSMCLCVFTRLPTHDQCSLPVCTCPCVKMPELV